MTKLNLSFYFSNYNGSMKLVIKNNGTVLTTFENATAGIHTVDCEIVLPGQLQFEISGKNYNTDTQVVDQKIVNDKFIQLRSMSLGQIPLGEALLFKLCSYQTDRFDEVRYDLFWGFNGIACIDINEANFIKYHLSLNNTFDY